MLRKTRFESRDISTQSREHQMLREKILSKVAGTQIRADATQLAGVVLL